MIAAWESSIEPLEKRLLGGLPDVLRGLSALWRPQQLRRLGADAP